MDSENVWRKLVEDEDNHAIFGFVVMTLDDRRYLDTLKTRLEFLSMKIDVANWEKGDYFRNLVYFLTNNTKLEMLKLIFKNEGKVSNSDISQHVVEILKLQTSRRRCTSLQIINMYMNGVHCVLTRPLSDIIHTLTRLGVRFIKDDLNPDPNSGTVWVDPNDVQLLIDLFNDSSVVAQYCMENVIIKRTLGAPPCEIYFDNNPEFSVPKSVRRFVNSGYQDEYRLNCPSEEFALHIGKHYHWDFRRMVTLSYTPRDSNLRINLDLNQIEKTNKEYFRICMARGLNKAYEPKTPHDVGDRTGMTKEIPRELFGLIMKALDA